MVIGKFVGSDKPTVPVSLAWNDAIQSPHFILDTGFTGDLVVTPEIAKDLGINPDSVSKVQVAGNNLITVKASTVVAVMEGKKFYVTVYVTEGWPLIGIGFMEKFGYTAVVDCKNKKVHLEAAI